MKNGSQRICIYPKDVQLITGKSYKYARELLQEIKAHYRKKNHQYISIYEFCQYTGLNLAEVIPLIIN